MTAVPPKRSTSQAQVDDLERRVRALESAPRAAFTAVNNGTFSVLDENGTLVCQMDQFGFIQFTPSGNEQVRIGKLQEGPDRYGIRIRKDTGAIVFYVADTGDVLPDFRVPWVSFDIFAETDSAVYIDVYKHRFYSMANGIDYHIFAVPNAGNTMDVRIRAQEVGGTLVTVDEVTGITVNTNITGPFAIPASALISGTDPVGREIEVRYEMRRTAGASLINLRQVNSLLNLKV
jgi:hypothetical protein